MKFDRFFPLQGPRSDSNILIAACASLLALGMVVLTSNLTLSGHITPILVASMGASAVLLFAVPSSPMSRPWPFVGGNLLSATIGVGCAQWIPDITLAIPLAIALSMLAMNYLRCLHAPGGALALIAILGGDNVHSLGFQFVLTPVALNVTVLLAMASLYWHFSQQRQHSNPHYSSLDLNWQRREQNWLHPEILLTEQNLEQARAAMDTYIDVSIPDLAEIYDRALQQAHSEKLGHLRCGEVMTQPAIHTHADAELRVIWRLFEKRRIRGIPIVDAQQRIEGIVTITDFIRHASKLEGADLPAKLAQLRKPAAGRALDKPEVAGQIMTTAVITAHESDRLSDLVQVFSRHGIHHLPVVNDSEQLVGMLTRGDIMTAYEKNKAEKATPASQRAG